MASIAALISEIPTGPRPTRADIFGSVQVNYKLFLNIFGVVVFAALFWITARRGSTDPSCGMTVDRRRAIKKEIAGQTYYFCSEHCLHSFEAASGGESPPHAPPAHEAVAH